MTSVATRPTRVQTDSDSHKLRWSRWRARNPESATVALVVGAWIAMAIFHWANHDADQTALVSGDHATELGLWAVMVVAMMVPGTIGMVRRLALDSLFSRRQRNVALFTIVYVAWWTAVAALLLVVEQALSRSFPALDVRGTPILVLALAAASVWQISAPKSRLLNACHLRGRIAPRGRAADLSVIRYASRHATACIGSCWLVMVAMFVAGHDFHLMVPLAVITTYERWVKRPQHAAAAWGLVTVAAMAAFGLL